jgi:uncharacterized protein YjbJ (UPF0337 family)
MSERTDEAKGRAKEAVGSLTDDERLKREGKLDRAGAGVKRATGAAKDQADRAVENAKDRARDAMDRDEG